MQKELEDLCRGGLQVRRLPRLLHIWHLKEDYSELWEMACQDQVEWGACLDLGISGLALVDQNKGTKDCVAPLCLPLALDSDYIGFAHVHLPDPEWGIYIGFSAVDYRATLADGDRLALVHNGEEVFALVRTAATILPQEIADQTFEEWKKMYKQALDSAKGSVNEELWKVNRELCQRLGFAFYRGRFGEPLQRIYQPLGRAQ